jgi:CO/xanthine dehydrogenase FAD-binding subunit
MKPVPFDYYAPSSVSEALDLLANLGYAGKVLAGGQSLIPAMNFRMARPGALVDLNGIPDLDTIRPAVDGSVAIGTMTRDAAVEHHAETIKRFPILAEVLPNIGHIQIRNRGTFGGAIAHADPAGQLPMMTVLLNPKLKILKKGGERWMNGEEFFMGPFMTYLEPDEMLAEVVLNALPERTGSSYQQVSRQSGGYAQAAVASQVTLDESGRCKQVRLVLGSVGDMPLLSQVASNVLNGQVPTPAMFMEIAEKAAKSECDPGTDVHATAEYRRHLVRVLTVRSLTEAVAKARN